MSFGNIYKIPFAATLTTNPCDLVGILAPNNSQVVLREFIVGAVSTSQPQGQLFQVSIFRGSTASSTSAAITPVQILPQTSPAPCVAGSSVTGPSSGLVSTASATLIHTDSWSAAFQSYVYFQDDPAMRARCDVSQRLHVRLSAPSTALAIVGTATIEEIGRRTN
jgi:hypothetical protein